LLCVNWLMSKYSIILKRQSRTSSWMRDGFFYEGDERHSAQGVLLRHSRAEAGIRGRNLAGHEVDELDAAVLERNVDHASQGEIRVRRSAVAQREEKGHF
jgi:hypothetical protein